jgi:hypothetical protein
MLRWPFRLWVLLLALLLQIGRGQALIDSAQPAELGHLPFATSGEADAPEETPEGSSLVDEAFEAGMSSSNSPELWRQDPRAERRCAKGLSPGRPASDTPFKPPRA